MKHEEFILYTYPASAYPKITVKPVYRGFLAWYHINVNFVARWKIEPHWFLEKKYRFKTRLKYDGRIYRRVIVIRSEKDRIALSKFILDHG